MTERWKALRRCCSARRPGGGGGQGGFALAAVLGVIVLTAVTIGALLGMMLTVIRITSAQEQSGRDLRAADSAVEAAIAQMRRDPAGIGIDPCRVGGAGPLGSIDFDQRTSPTGDDVEVSLDCTPVNSDLASASSDQVRLVGARGYQGDIDPSALPWASVIGAAMPSGMSPNLVHSGHEALRFDSGLTVRGGAAALRDPATDTPAISAAGAYLQGRPGPLGSGTECGILSPAYVGTRAGAVVDLDGEPECGSDSAKEVDPGDAQTVEGFEVTNSTPVVPVCAPVVRIDAGPYDATLTAQLNSLIAGCTATFWFAPGVFSFDVDSGTASPERNALVLGDESSYYVFGTPRGWNPASQGAGAVAEPAEGLCDPSVSGTSIVLSGRTEIRHLGGRVDICPAFDPADAEVPFPAIYQASSIPGTIEVTSASALPVSRLFRCTVPCTQRVQERSYDLPLVVTGSQPIQSMRLLLTGTEGSSTPNNAVTGRATRIDVRRADNSLLCSTGARAGTPNGDLASSFELRTGTCAGAIDDVADLAGATLRVVHSMRLEDVRVFGFSVTAEQRLTITDIDLQINGSLGTGNSAAATAGAWSTATVGNLLADDGQVARPTDSCPHLACWASEPDGLRTPDEPWVHEVTVSGMSVEVPQGFVDDRIDPNLTELQARLDLRPSSNTLAPELISFLRQFVVSPTAEYFRPEMTVDLELTTADGARCTSSTGSVNSDHEITFDLLRPEDSLGSCVAVLERYSQLQGASLRVRFSMPCVRQNGAPWSCASAGAGPDYQVIRVLPPAVQFISLAASTDTYNGPPPTSKVEINARTGADSSTFHAQGDVLMPTSDLDVHWRGGVAAGRPLVTGDLMLNGLGSDMVQGAQMGSVCCSATRPDSRTVKLVATVAGVERLVVTVRFNDLDENGAYSAGHSVEILDWTGCRGGACPSVLAQNVSATTTTTTTTTTVGPGP